MAFISAGCSRHCRPCLFLLWCWKYVTLRENVAGVKALEVTIHLLDALAQRIQARWEDVPRHVLESFVLEGFRTRLLTTGDVRRLLGLETKFEVHAFLKEHDVPFYTLAGLERDRDTSRKLSSC